MRDYAKRGSSNKNNINSKKTISSSLIRKKISLGKIKEANKLLSRPWSVKGKVITGKRRGRKIARRK